MKINFVANRFAGSWMYRCYTPANNSKNDCRLDIDPLTEVITPRTDITEADVVIFHRSKDKGRLEMIKMLKKKGVVIGYDNDDTWNFYDGHPAFTKGEIPLDQHKEILKEVDFITASTDFLANEYKEFNNNVYTLPNLIDFDKYPSPIKANNKKKRILITGSVLWCKDGINFVNTLKRLAKKYQLVIFGNSHRLKGLDAEYHPYINPMYYPQKLKDLNIDLCIIPREENYFNRCKSACKYLEMAASKIPVVAQSFSTKDSPYDLVAKQGAPIVLATYDWEEKIEQALEKAEDGYDWVYKNYNAKDNKFDKIVNQFKPVKKDLGELERVKGDIKVYTAIIGGVDTPRNDIQCFSEPVGFNLDVMNAKRYKILSHEYIDEDISIWIDGNIKLLADPRQLASEWLRDGADIGVWNHSLNNCIYQEAEEAKEIRVPKKYHYLIDKQIEKYRNEGYPENNGLAECNVIIRRNNKKVKRFNEAWWKEITENSWRDQLSFPYVAWKQDIKINYINGNPRLHSYFQFNKHIL